MIAVRRFIAEWGAELEVDLLAIGLDLPQDFGTPRLTVGRLRRIISSLGQDSAVARAKRDNGPSIDTLLLRQIEFYTRAAFWQGTKDGQHNRNKPVPIPFASDKTRHPRAGMQTDELLARRQARRQEELAETS
jgi:hypothetical protein